MDICKYQVGNRYHHIVEDLSEELEIETQHSEPDDMYETSEEEYKSKKTTDKDFYHSVDGLNYEELRKDLDKVLIQEYKVSYQDEKSSFSFIVHCPPDGINKLEEELKSTGLQFQKEAEYSIAKGLYQNYCNQPSTSNVYIPIDEYDELAYLFNTEVEKRKTNQENMNTNTATIDKKLEVEEHKVVNTRELYTHLKECPREFLDVIAIYFKDKGARAKSLDNLGDKRQALYDLIKILNDVEAANKIEDFYNAIQESNSKIESAKDDLKMYEDDYLSARRDLKEAREARKELIVLKTEQVVDTLPEEDKQRANKYKDELAEAKARNERKKLRKRGLIAFAKGISAAKVDHLEEKYIASANTVAVQALEQTEILTKNLKAQKNIDVATLEGLEPLMEGLVSNINKLVEKVDDGENATAQELARLTHNEQQQLTAKVKEIAADNFKKVKENIEQSQSQGG